MRCTLRAERVLRVKEKKRVCITKRGRAGVHAQVAGGPYATRDTNNTRKLVYQPVMLYYHGRGRPPQAQMNCPGIPHEFFHAMHTERASNTLPQWQVHTHTHIHNGHDVV